MLLDMWLGQVRAVDQVLNKLSDEELEKEIAPLRNRGVYLLGHLTAVHDLMLPLLRFEESVYPDLQPIYIDSPDKRIALTPAASILRKQWIDVNETK